MFHFFCHPWVSYENFFSFSNQAFVPFLEILRNLLLSDLAARKHKLQLNNPETHLHFRISFVKKRTLRRAATFLAGATAFAVVSLCLLGCPNVIVESLFRCSTSTSSFSCSEESDDSSLSWAVLWSFFMAGLSLEGACLFSNSFLEHSSSFSSSLLSSVSEGTLLFMGTFPLWLAPPLTFNQS